MQNDVFDHNFGTKALRMTILVSESMLWGQRIWWRHLFCPMTLNFQGRDLCKITFWAKCQLLMGKHCQSSTRGSLRKAFMWVKISWMVCTQDVCQCVTLGTIMQKCIFYNNFLTKPLSMMSLVFRPILFMVKEFNSAIYFHQCPWSFKVSLQPWVLFVFLSRNRKSVPVLLLHSFVNEYTIIIYVISFKKCFSLSCLNCDRNY